MEADFYTENELNELGLKSFGKNVLISKKCSIYGAENMTIGNNVRIDDFCILSGCISIGNYVHIAAYSALYGRYGIEIQDFCGISARGTLYSAIDDFSGDYMVSPMVPSEFTKLTTGKIVLKKYTQIGCNSVVFPKVVVNEGAVTGALTLIKKDVPSWTIVAGIPARVVKERKKNLLEMAENLKSYDKERTKIKR